MTTLRIELDDATYERLRTHAQAQGRTVEELLTTAAGGVGNVPEDAEAAQADQIAARFADEPELMDRVLQYIMESRRGRWDDFRRRNADDVSGDA